MDELIFDLSREGRGGVSLPEWDCGNIDLMKYKGHLRENLAELPEVAEVDLVRHYVNASRAAFGVDNGFYPLGSCTMKYNPKVNETVAAMENFTSIHPLQPEESVQGSVEVLDTLSRYLCEITGMDCVSLQPAAGAQGEFTSLLVLKKYLKHNNMTNRTKILIPDSAHGTNPASAAMCGFEVVVIPSGEDGEVDIEALRKAVGEDTAALMMTNPNTVGLFETGIKEIAGIVHGAGGLLYYDGANMNAVMGVARPGDMGFDLVHLNLHKTFSTPHGGGGPGSGPCGCKSFLKEFMPGGGANSIGRVHSFNGNFSVCLKALAYIVSLGGTGLKSASENAVLNANYLMKKLTAKYKAAYDRDCMHEFVLTLSEMKKETSVSAADIAKNMIDGGIHPPTMYFPLIVDEALMFEPTETESVDTLDFAAEYLLQLFDKAYANAEEMKRAPVSTVIGRPDEVAAARNLKLTQEIL